MHAWRCHASEEWICVPQRARLEIWVLAHSAMLAKSLHGMSLLTGVSPTPGTSRAVCRAPS